MFTTLTKGETPKEQFTKMHRNIGTFHSRDKIVGTAWKLYFTINILFLFSSSSSSYHFGVVVFLGLVVRALDKSWLIIKEVYFAVRNNNRREKYIELNDPNWNVCVSIVHKCSTPFRFILWLWFPNIAAVCHHTYYWLLLLSLLCAIWYSLQTSERKTQHSKKAHFYGFCFVLIRLNRKLLFFVSNLTLGSIQYNIIRHHNNCFQIHCTAMNSMSAERA